MNVELDHALDALKNLSYKAEKGDIEDKFSSVGHFLYYELDDVIQAVDEAIDDLREQSIVIDEQGVDLRKTQEELERSAKVGNHT